MVAGRAVLEVDGARTPVGTGRVAYVPARVSHRFVDVTVALLPAPVTVARAVAVHP